MNGFISFIVYRYVIGNILKKMSGVFLEVSKGNLKVECGIHSKDDIGKMADSINMMIASLYKLIRSLYTVSEQVSTTAEQLSNSFVHTEVQTHELRNAMDEVLAGNDFQQQQTEESKHAINEITATIQDVTMTIGSKSEWIASLASGTESDANTGTEIVDNVIAQMQLIDDTVSKTTQMITLLAEHSKEIHQFVHFITEISAQTKMLALNAGIEAARVGEHGRGFSIVANEVHLLSEQTASSTQQIAQLIQAIQNDITQSVQFMTLVSNEVKRGKELAEGVGAKFHSMVGDVDQISTQLHYITSTTNQMYSAVEEMVSSIEEIASISKKTKETTSSVSKLTEHQLTTVGRNTNLAKYLQEISNELMHSLQRFSV